MISRGAVAKFARKAFRVPSSVASSPGLGHKEMTPSALLSNSLRGTYAVHRSIRSGYGGRPFGFRAPAHLIGSACWTLIFTRSDISMRCRLAAKGLEVSGYVVAHKQLASALRLAPRRGVLCPFLQWLQQLAAPLRLAPPSSRFDATDPHRAPGAPSTPSSAADGDAADPRGRSPGGAIANRYTPSGVALAGSANRRKHVGDRRLWGCGANHFRQIRHVRLRPMLSSESGSVLRTTPERKRSDHRQVGRGR